MIEVELKLNRSYNEVDSVLRSGNAEVKEEQ
jgi:hypothetical protein